MKLKNIVNKAKQNTVSFFKDPKKVQGLAVGIVGMVCTGLLVNEVNTSKHKKELKDAKNYYLDFGFGEGMKNGNFDTLDMLNFNDKISKEDAILYGKAYDDAINESSHKNDVIKQHFNEFSNRNQEIFEDILD